MPLQSRVRPKVLRKTRITPPDWAMRPIGPEPRPPRPLAPSSAGEDLGSDPPLPPEMLKVAAQRGVLMHSLLERLPDVPRDDREAAALSWLGNQATDLPESAHKEMVSAALGVLDEPGFAAIFGPDALAEVPLAATVDGQVIAGTADRLLVTPEKVTVVDFKTARRPPSELAGVPRSTLKQMSAYAAALQIIYPERAIEAAVLYTQTPVLIAIPADVLERHKPTLGAPEESYRV